MLITLGCRIFLNFFFAETGQKYTHLHLSATIFDIKAHEIFFFKISFSPKKTLDAEKTLSNKKPHSIVVL